MFALYIDTLQAHWLTTDGQVAHGSLGDAADAAEGADVCVLVPAETVVLTSAALPPIRQAGRRLNAARYALEEQLAARVETLHFALGDKQAAGAGQTNLAVTDRERMRTLTQTLANAGLQVSHIMPDVLALPRPRSGQWQLYALGQRMLARTGPCHGFACELPLWPALAAGAPQAPEHVVLLADDAAPTLAGPDSIPGAPDIEQRPVQPHDALVAAMLAQATQHAPLNLCQGEFARYTGLQRWWQPFRATAALAIVCLVLLVGTRGVAAYQVQQRLDRLHARGMAAFNAAFPDVHNINNLRVQARQEMAALRHKGGQGAMFPLLQATAEVMSETPGIRMKTLQYRNGELILSLAGSSVQALEQLRDGFKQRSRVKLDIKRADAAGDGVRIRATVSAA